MLNLFETRLLSFLI